jgi:hypothetical protein
VESGTQSWGSVVHGSKGNRDHAEREKSQRLRAAVVVLPRCIGTHAAGHNAAEQRCADGKGVGEGLMGGADWRWAAVGRLNWARPQWTMPFFIDPKFSN